MQLVVEISEDTFFDLKKKQNRTEVDCAILNGIPIPKGHGRLIDEDEIVKSIEDRVEFLRKNDAVFVQLRKDIDILGCIPKIRCEVPTIIEADKTESEDKK